MIGRILRFFGQYPDSAWEPVGIYGGVVVRPFHELLAEVGPPFAAFIPRTPGQFLRQETFRKQWPKK